VPDFVLRCTVCGGEVLWDTDQLPPAGTPQVGDPVLWSCVTCRCERRHRIESLCLVAEKLRHAVSVATEIDGPTVERVMAAAERFRRAGDDCPGPRGAADERTAVADAAGVPAEVVDRIAVAEAAWLCRRGYIQDMPAER
jgi:hypothetical protein